MLPCQRNHTQLKKRDNDFGNVFRPIIEATYLFAPIWWFCDSDSFIYLSMFSFYISLSDEWKNYEHTKYQPTCVVLCVAIKTFGFRSLLDIDLYVFWLLDNVLWKCEK